MYKISVPVDSGTMARFGREETLTQIRRFDAERVFLSINCYVPDEERRKKELQTLCDNAAFLRENGYEVGAWIWTFMFEQDTPFTCMTGLRGERYGTYACPADEAFVSFASEYIADIARCGVDLIMFDDDFRYGFFGGSPACLCENHVKLINGALGTCYDRQSLCDRILTGGKNEFRDAYIKANGDAFRAFARRMREAVDSVDPSIRLGFCTCMTGWDIDGVDAAEIARILAGGTRPFVRLIGAPYWAVNQNWGNLLQDTVELERMESVWTRNGDIELMAEGDAYPRPRINCPASFLEGYDTAIRASGCTDGILKYGIDYTSRPDTETGYARMHERNRPAYRFIDENFSGDPCGVRVYSEMRKFARCMIKDAYPDPQDLIFPMASRSLAYCSVPTKYKGAGVCAVFDENARYVSEDQLSHGAIIDITAAGILTERGTDCGLRSAANEIRPEYEYFADGDRIAITGAVIRDITVDGGAEILSRTEDGVPVSYFYENASGTRFLVLNVIPRKSTQTIMRHGKRGRQYADAVKRLSGKALPFFIPDSPALYVQCRRDGGKLSVGIWNFFPDPVLNPVAELSELYDSAVFFNCSGELSKDKLTLSDIPPYSFVSVILK